MLPPHVQGVLPRLLDADAAGDAVEGDRSEARRKPADALKRAEGGASVTLVDVLETAPDDQGALP